MAAHTLPASAAPVGAVGAHARGRATTLAMLSLPFVAAVSVRLALGPRTVDDAFITLRYARNLAAGQGLVYNPGEWVLGTTTPAWAVLLAALHRLTAADLQALALVLAALADGASAALLAYLARRQGWNSVAATVVGFCWAASALSVAYATGGMETSLFVLASLVALTLASTPHLTSAAVVAGALYLVRPEGAIVYAAVVLSHWIRRRAFPVSTATLGLIPGVLWTAVALALYGSPVPQSVAAKSVAYHGVSPFENALAFLFHAGSPGWSTFALARVAPVVALGVVGVALALYAALALNTWRGRTPGGSWLPFLLFGLGYIAFHVLAGLRGVRLFPWYLVPMVPLYLLLLSAGLRRVTPVPSWPALVALLAWQLAAFDWQQPPSPRGLDLRREVAYQRVGSELGRQYPPGTSLAAPEIGALGYFSGLRLLDTVGLVSPSASHYYPLPATQVLGDNAIPPLFLEAHRPDLVVSLDQFVARSVLPDPWFQASYVLERREPLAIFQSQELLVFRRADLPRP